MNSENMWISHVNGKRHLKNVNKAPGEAPSKVKFVKSNAPARLLDVIADWESYEENRTEIICGLDYICERHLENGHELYNCYLCHSNCTPREIIDHLISLKHMRKYIEKEDPAAAENLTKLTTNMSNYGIKSLHLEACVNLVKERGVGKIEVLVPK
ncbi:uncharacterized protein LOC129232247 [Uloborus diversus]|nr:uncharacterized protein LOC129232247 [Uloborus diversus]